MTAMATETPARPLSELLLAGVGWASQGLDAADQLADELAKRLGMETLEVRAAMRESLGKLRDEAGRLGSRSDEALDGALAKAGLARREALEELDLRVAQLEHRLSLLEGTSPSP